MALGHDTNGGTGKVADAHAGACKTPVHLDERRGLDADCWSYDSGAQEPAVKSDQFAEYAEAGEDQNDQRPGHGTVQKYPHGSPKFIATIPGCPQPSTRVVS